MQQNSIDLDLLEGNQENGLVFTVLQTCYLFFVRSFFSEDAGQPETSIR
ncbi:hypothetical protein [Runella sp.]